MQQFLSYVLSPKGVIYGAKEMDFVTGNIDFDFKFTCDDNCELTNMIGMGDSVKGFLIQEHKIAGVMRQKALYHQNTEPILKKYPSVKINGEQEIKEVTQEILNTLIN